MKRIIPKQSKVKTALFKDFNTVDLIYLSISGILIFLLLTSNLPGKIVFSALFAVVVVALFLLKFDNTRLYFSIFIFLRFVVSKKQFVGNDQTAVKDVDHDTILFKQDKYYAGVIKLDPMEFFLLSEKNQDSLIECFSLIFKNLSIGQKLSIYKLDRPVFLDDFLDELKNKIDKSAEEITESKLSQAKFHILKSRYNEMKKINVIDNCCYYNAFYVVIYDTSRVSLTTTILNDLKELQQGGIQANRIKDEELIGFVKRTQTQVFDEREIKDLKREEISEYLTPSTVVFDKKFAEVDGIRETTFVVNRYPLETFNAWATALCNIDFTKIVLNVTPVDLELAIKTLDKSANEIEERYYHTGKMSARNESELHYQSLKYLSEQIGNNNEVMLNCQLSITAYDYDKKGASFRKEMKKTINKLSFRSSYMNDLQLEAYRVSNLNNSLSNSFVHSQGINSSSLAAGFPFVANMLMEKNGVMLGENSAPVIIDFFKRNNDYKNSNIVVLGSVGGGKSFFAKTLFTNLLSDEKRVFIFDPESEYTTLAKNAGGKIIDMGLGGNIINPFAVLCYVALDVDNEEQGQQKEKNALAGHLTFLEKWLKRTLDTMTNELIEIVLSVLPELYEMKNINNQTDFRNFKGEFPTFDDLYNYFEKLIINAESADEKSKYKTIKMYISKFCGNGRYAYLWNGQTNLKANEDFVVFNFQSLLANSNETIAAGQMLLLTQYLNNELIINYEKIKKGIPTKPIVIAIDEAHIFIDPNNPVALTFMKLSAKRCRKYNGMQVVMTQSVNDFLGGQELERHSKAVITECQYTFVFPLNASSASDFLKLYDKLDITADETSEIINNARGTAFFIASNKNRTSIRIVASNMARGIFDYLPEGKEFNFADYEEKAIIEPEATPTKRKYTLAKAGKYRLLGKGIACK